MAQIYAESAIATLAEIMEDSEGNPQARIAAAKELLDRGYGKPTQHVEASGKEGAPPLGVVVIPAKRDD
jgi:hypothetical protein